MPISTCSMALSSRALQGFAPGGWLRVLLPGQGSARGAESPWLCEAGISSAGRRGAGGWLLCKDEARAGWQRAPCAVPRARVPVGSRLGQQHPQAPLCPLSQGPHPQLRESWPCLLHAGITLQALSIPIPLPGNSIPTLQSPELLLLLERWVIEPWATPVPRVPSSVTAPSPWLGVQEGQAGPPQAGSRDGSLHLQQRSAAGCSLLGSHRLRNVKF